MALYASYESCRTWQQGLPGARRTRGSLTTQAQIPVPGAGFLSDRENWCEGTVWGLRP